MKEISNRSYKEGESIIFNSQNDNKILSNMFRCKINYNDIVFNSTEHLYQWLKFTDNKDIGNIILHSSSPFEAKKESKKYERYINQNYENEKINNMIITLQLKYNQCKLFRGALIKSGDKNLVEYCYWMKERDKPYWGTVFDDSRQMYVGTNATGRLMMKVREDNKN